MCWQLFLPSIFFSQNLSKLFPLLKMKFAEAFLNYFIKEKPYKKSTSLYLVETQIDSMEVNDSFDGYDENSIKVSLICPITNSQIKVPARSILCDHVDCFDITAFMEINKTPGLLTCPVCQNDIRMIDLIKDGLICSILKTVPKKCYTVKITKNGHFTALYDSNEEEEENSTLNSARKIQYPKRKILNSDNNRVALHEAMPRNNSRRSRRFSIPDIDMSNLTNRNHDFLVDIRDV